MSSSMALADDYFPGVSSLNSAKFSALYRKALLRREKKREEEKEEEEFMDLRKPPTMSMP